ncbi:MAG: alpha/beta hydrolase [Bacteroidales bacterium]|nr:alpha/beta hydrolase [Bacteroidales bacterium]
MGDVAELLPAPPSQPRVETFRASDGYDFYLRHWRPTGVPRARIVWLHGIRSHGGWYTRSCGELVAAGYEVVFLDRRGAGWNSAHRGDSPSFRRLLDDVIEYIKHLRREKAGLPLYLGGISWGGKLAVGVPYRCPGLVQGLILACPGLVPIIAPPFVQRMRIAAARLLRPSRLFPIPLNEPELFTADAQGQEFIAQDRFGLRQASARFLFGSFGLDVYLRRAARQVVEPTLLLLAGQDRIISNPGTRDFVRRFRSTDLSVIEYPSAHHTLEMEGPSHPFVTDIIQWIGNR